MLVSSLGRQADVHVSVLALRKADSGRFAAFGDVELLIDGVSIGVRGLQVLTNRETVAMPQYRRADGRWQAALSLPQSVVAVLEASLTHYWGGGRLPPQTGGKEGAALVTCALRDLRPLRHPRILAEATVVVTIDDVAIEIAGVQLVYTVKHRKEQKATLRFPHYKAADGSWQPVISLPHEVLTPIWELVLESCVEAGVLDDHHLEFTDEPHPADVSVAATG